jgi:hypothetical protein
VKDCDRQTNGNVLDKYFQRVPAIVKYQAASSKYTSSCLF